MLRAGATLLVRPGLWPTAVRQVRRLARPRWWSRPPFLPLPDPSYLHFRLVTMYGGSEKALTDVEPSDMIEYLDWCRRWPEASA